MQITNSWSACILCGNTLLVLFKKKRSKAVTLSALVVYVSNVECLLSAYHLLYMCSYFSKIKKKNQTHTHTRRKPTNRSPTSTQRKKAL